MIKKLTLVNFRSHKKSIVEFSEGVNVLVGRGQAGKTNIKRALEWLCTNRPRGDKVHSFWCEKGDITSVTLDTTEGYTIEIRKALGGSVEYSLCGPTGDWANWEKVGGHVPDKVLEALNLCELNIQNQLDAPYLITAGTGEISRAVNQAVDLDQADQWITEFNRRKKANAGSITTLTEQLGEANKQLDAYATVPEAKELLDAALSDAYALDKLIAENSDLAERIEGIYDAKDQIEQLSALPEIEDITARAQSVDELLTKAESKHDSLERILGVIDSAERDLDRLARCKQISSILRRTELITNKYEAAQSKQAVCSAVIEADQALSKTTDEYLNAVDEYVDVLDEIGVCPTCFTPVDQETLDYVVEGLEGGET